MIRNPANYVRLELDWMRWTRSNELVTRELSAGRVRERGHVRIIGNDPNCSYGVFVKLYCLLIGLVTEEIC